MYKRILTIQDISCFGQCSLTVALPILSACSLETVILPSAVLSTHTMGFTGYTVHDLTESIPLITSHWKKEGITFNAVYTGYLGSATQIEYVKEIFNSLLKKDGLKIVDPAMADMGKLYPAFDSNYVKKMRELCSVSDIILPNITEACFLTQSEYKIEYSLSYIKNLVLSLKKMGAKTVVLTGVGFALDSTGVFVSDEKEEKYYEHNKIPENFHGTGDVYASAFTGAFLQGHSVYESACIAADFVVSCIKQTQPDKGHRYGVEFEKVLGQLISKVVPECSD